MCNLIVYLYQECQFVSNTFADVVPDPIKICDKGQQVFWHFIYIYMSSFEASVSTSICVTYANKEAEKQGWWR